MSSMKFSGVYLNELNANDKSVKRVFNKPLILQISDECDNLLIRFKENDMMMANNDYNIEIFKESELCKFGDNCILINDNYKNGLRSNNFSSSSTSSSSTLSSAANSIQSSNSSSSSSLLGIKQQTWIIEFEDKSQCDKLHEILNSYKFNRSTNLSVFKQRTDETSASQYFQFYGYLSQQQNMMQDFIRTSTYQKAIILNFDDFRDKIVLDVGAGSGILSFFAIQAGAKKVYAVEASSMAKFAEQLVYSNKLADKISVIPGKIEEIQLPEKVDLIISEPMGYMLFNERMLETYLHAKKWLKEIDVTTSTTITKSRMFPSRGDLHIAPFTDASLYMEQLNKANFWYQENFHGVDLSSLRSAAIKEYFRQPIVDTFDIRICLAKSHRFTVDFETASENDLHNIHIPISFTIHQSGEVHGLAFWFDVAFMGSNQTVWLSTSPTQPLTHWYQVRCLVDTPLFVHRGQQLSGHVSLLSNKRQSYDVDIELYLDNVPLGNNTSNFNAVRARNTLDLKNPYFRYTGQPPQPPPGTHETSPSEQYWQTIDASNSTAVHNINNGSMNGVLNGGVPITDMSSFQQQHNLLSNNSGTNSIGVIGLHQPSMMNFGSLPSPGSTNRSSSGHSRNSNTSSAPPSSIGGGISPSFFASNSSMSVINAGNFPVSNNLMIGDYVTPGNIPGNIMVSGQNNLPYKH